VTIEELTRFVRNCSQVTAFKMNSIRKEQEEPNWFEDVMTGLSDPADTCAPWLVAIKAFEKTATKSGNAASFANNAADEASEFAAMKEEAKTITDAMGLESEIDERYLRELLRYGRSKLHCVSSFLGGVASQEACKLVMSQYIPMNHTFIYDGIHGKGEVFNL